MPRGSDPNRCRASEIERFEPISRTKPRRQCVQPVLARVAPQIPVSTPPRARCTGPALTCDSPAPGSHLKEESTKTAILKAYAEWVAAGRRREESPLDDLVQQHGCSRAYPKRLYDKVMRSGSVSNPKSPGRKKEFSPRCWEQMQTVIREHRERQKTASSRVISASLKKTRGKRNRCPSRDTVWRRKTAMGYRKHKVKKKPRLSEKLWTQRLEMAQERICSTDAEYIRKNARTVLADEKWCSEEKVTCASFEARDSSPVRASLRFRAKDAETRTQLIKIMYMFCVTSKVPIGAYELDFKTWNAKHEQKTKKGEPALKGITAPFFRHILLKVAKDTRKVLGRGKISFLHDKATVFQTIAKDPGQLGEAPNFDGGLQLAAGKGPDMSHCDAGICPFMEREIEQAGATTAEEIRAVVKRAWKRVTPDMCEKISKRVRRNMQKVIDLKGGNFYDEK